MDILRKITVLVYVLYALTAQAQTQVEFIADDDKPVEICGTLRQEQRWGPPNFGEEPATDSKFRIWLVSLDKPITVRYGRLTNKTTLGTLSDIQIEHEPSGDETLERLDHKSVRVTGKLWTSTSQGDVGSPVFVYWSEIKSAGNAPACNHP